MTEREKMLAGELYDASDPELVDARRRAREATRRFNDTADMAVLRELFGACGERVQIEPPFHCDYGTYIEIGDRFFANFGLVVLDCNVVRIGNDVQFGPYVQLLAATHPLAAQERAAGPEYGFPITIDDHAWLGGGAIVLPGVTVGARSVVGSGAVVTKDVPPDVVVGGNPARVLRELA